eukprot:3945256-Pyramimonas_sp.AAC.2
MADMGAMEAEKEKYEDTLEGLRKDGWEPVLYIGIRDARYLPLRLLLWGNWVYEDQNKINY